MNNHRQNAPTSSQASVLDASTLSFGDSAAVSRVNGADHPRRPDRIDGSNPEPLLPSKVPAVPSLALPKASGGIKGVGEKFSVNLTTGTGRFSFPIRVSSGRSGIQPSLSLDYDSAYGNGEFGLGWRLSGFESITRKTSKGIPRYYDHGYDEDADVFLLAGSEDLVPVWKLDDSGNVLLSDDGRPSYDERNVDGYIARKYSPRIVTVFNSVERWTSVVDRNDIHWRVISPDNVTTVLGLSSESRIYDTSAVNGKQRIFSWLQDQVYDPQGNAMLFTYKREDDVNVPLSRAHEGNRTSNMRRANLYLKRIQYGNSIPNRDPVTWKAFSAADLSDTALWNFSVLFDYGEHSSQNPKPRDTGNWACRSDPFSRYNSGFEVRTYRLCKRVMMFHHFPELGMEDFLVSSVDFTYDEGDTITYLASAELSGYSTDTSNSRRERASLPPVEFGYSRFPSQNELDKLVVQDIDPSSLDNIPIGLDETNHRWVDLDGEGISSVLAVEEGCWYYKRNMSWMQPSKTSPETEIDRNLSNPRLRFGPLEVVENAPFLSFTGQSMRFGDVNGNGKLDLICHASGQWGYFERDHDDTLGWTEFRTFSGFPNSGPQDSSMQYIDLTGDGLADILIAADRVYSWYPSRGSDGYGPSHTVTQPLDEIDGPVCLFADSEQTIYLADMSGDGLVDICRIRNGDCCYWPHLGYGRFGRQVCLDDAPWFDYPDEFTHKNLRVVDIDGSGPADLLYFSEAGVDIYLNNSGNSFSTRKRVSFPAANQATTVNIADLFGNGTTCLIWSSGLPGDVSNPMRYLDICQNKKPHMITKFTNNLGATTTVNYTSSTQFYLQDKEAGRPWVTRLPFPVQVVQSVETVDQISGNRFITDYSYHHGYFDGLEREFRGFARVEQSDSTDFSTMSIVPSANVNKTWHVPPVRTISWIHTGAYMNGDSLSSLLSKEYFGGKESTLNQSGGPSDINDVVVPTQFYQGLQMMEACRALKGQTLRTEIYCDDDSGNKHIPYSTHETRPTIIARQPAQDGNLHGIYFVYSQETLACQYERSLTDPRIAHQMILEVDGYGNVCKDLSIAYGRISERTRLTGEYKTRQESTLITYKETEYTKPLSGDHYRIPVPCQARQYEIRGLAAKQYNNRFLFGDVVKDNFAALLSIPILQFEDHSSSQSPSRRLLRQGRAMFRKDDLSGLLPLGDIGNMGLPGTKHDLVFSPGLIKLLFNKKQADGSYQALITGQELRDGKGYMDLDENGNYWTTSDRVYYTADFSKVETAQELEEARRSFFLPKSFLDPFGNASWITYDQHKHYPVQTMDAAKNVVSVSMDYRALEPALITDINGNRTAAAFDCMGMLAGTAVLGKPSDNLGDNLDNFNTNLPREKLQRFLEDPSLTQAAELLGNATSRIVYDLWRVKDHKKPTITATIQRETHLNRPLPPGGAQFQIQISYSDGFGRQIQTKTRTKSGKMTKDGPIIDDLWVGSGWTVYNNKGKPVKQFEPFFDTTAEYQPDMKVGVSSTLFYDPVGRVVAVLRPDRAFEKTVTTPWDQKVFDADDNILLLDPRKDPDVGQFFANVPVDEYLPSWYTARVSGQLGEKEQEAAVKTESHDKTDTTSHFDSLGRPFLIITKDGDQELANFTDLDMLGNGLQTRDALNRKTLVVDHDMCSRPIHTASMDTGDSWTLPDVGGRKLFRWTSRNYRFRFGYDELRRPVRSWWQDGTEPEILTSEIVYGEKAADAHVHNLRGQTWRVWDQSGLLTQNDFDFAGNLLKFSRRLATSYKDTLHISQDMALENEEHVASASYDALGRAVRTVAPDETVTYRIYNQTTQVDRIYVNIKGEKDPESEPSTWTPILSDVQYNAKGQVTATRYGNGTTVTRTYDDQTFRLRRLYTSQPGGAPMQDLRYTYDPVGNITSIKDDAQQPIYFRNTVVTPTCDYAYDTLYRLISASGREHLGQTNGRPVSPVTPDSSDRTLSRFSHPNDGKMMGRYDESYKYDAAGNLLSIQHVGTDPRNPGWTRNYGYDISSQLEKGMPGNLLSQTTVGGKTEHYKYQGSAGTTGHMTSMAHLPFMRWNFTDQLTATSRSPQPRDSALVPETTYYVYDWQGQRVRKVRESQAGANFSPRPFRIKECVYLGDYEICRKYTPHSQGPEDSDMVPERVEVQVERTTLHINTPAARLADIEFRTQGVDESAPRQIRFQYANHLGSACLELDLEAQILSYEEYFPFGGTSYQAVANQTDVPKRYRYSGKELDDENGLYYFGARYYAAWLGRWTAPDPVVGPGSPYKYASNNPIKLVDPDGRQPKPTSGAGGGGGWIGITNSGPLGTAVHNVVLYTLQERLYLMSPRVPSLAEYKTLEGGSKSNPYGDTKGEVDLAVLEQRLFTNRYTAHNYELKPDNKQSQRKTYDQVMETKLYSNHFDRNLPNGGVVEAARTGMILESLEQQNPLLMAPVLITTPAVDVRISMRLPSGDKPGQKRPGLIVYKVEARFKQSTKNEQRQEVVIRALDQLRDRQRLQGPIPLPKPIGQDQPEIFPIRPPVVADSGGKGQKPESGGGEGGGGGSGKEVYIPRGQPANDNAEPEEEGMSTAAKVGIGVLVVGGVIFCGWAVAAAFGVEVLATGTAATAGGVLIMKSDDSKKKEY